MEKLFSLAARRFSPVVVRLTAAAFFHTFITLKFDAMIIENIGSAADKNFLAVFYSAVVAVLGLGCALFPVSKAFLRSSDGGGKENYSPVVALASAAFVCSVSVLAFSPNLPVKAFFTLVAALNLGYFIAWQLWGISMFLDGTGYAGRVLGVSVLTATLALNYSSALVKPGAMELAVIASFMSVSVTVLHRLGKSGVPAPAAEDARAFDEGLPAVAAVALMTVSFAVSNGLFIKIYSGGDMVYTMRFYQTIHGLTAFFFGFLFDIGKGENGKSRKSRRSRKKACVIFLPAFLVAAFTFAPLFLSVPGYGTALFGITGWSYAGLFCVLYMLPFVEMAPRTNFPELWASCGAITRYLLSGIVIIPTALLAEFVDYRFIALINIFIAALLFKVFSFRRAGTAPCEPCESAAEPLAGEEIFARLSVEDQTSHIEKFVRKYSLTSAEANAMLHIISSEESLKVISSKEKISERTFQRYLSKIYEKTGTKTRAGLVAMYYMKAWVSGSGSGSDDLGQ